jgi:hypothetical protein
MACQLLDLGPRTRNTSDGPATNSVTIAAKLLPSDGAVISGRPSGWCKLENAAGSPSCQTVSMVESTNLLKENSGGLIREQFAP